MIQKCINIIILIHIPLALTFSVPGQATEKPEKTEVTASTSQISIAGFRGTAAERRLVLTASGPVSGVRLVKFDLVRADDQQVFPADSIEARLPAGQITSKSPLEIPLTFNLSHGAGEYKGEMLILYDGGRLTIPVTVRIKEDRWLAMALILLGVVTASGLTYYRRKGQPRDEAIKLAGNLRAQARTDSELPSSFGKRIDSHLIDCEAAIQAENWEEAKKAVESGIAVMTGWRKWRSDWKKQLEYLAELTAKVKTIRHEEGDTNYIVRLMRRLEDEEESAPSRKDPNELRDKLDVIRICIDRLIDLNALRNMLARVISELPPDKVELWDEKGQKWDARIGNLSPDDEEAFKSLREEIKTGIGEARKLVPQARDVHAKGFRLFDSGIIRLELSSPPPAVQGPAEFDEAGAAHRLKQFKILAAAIGVLFLAGIGYNELYLTKPTFGSNGWYDYFSLLAWGFGAEATRASVIDLMKSWGMQ